MYVPRLDNKNVDLCVIVCLSASHLVAYVDYVSLD